MIKDFHINMKGEGGGPCMEKVGIIIKIKKKKKKMEKSEKAGGETEASFRSLQSNSPSGSKFPPAAGDAL